MKQDRIKIWDPFVRFFHWSLVGSFLLAFLTEDDWLTLHVWAGYAAFGLVVMRLLWGFVGTQHARFSDFLYRPAIIKQYLFNSLRFRAPRYLGHNPAGGAMVMALLLSLLLTGITGLAVYGVAENAGPLAGWFNTTSLQWHEALEEVHEFFANFTLLLVGVHVAGVLFSSWSHGENLVRAMWHGYKRRTVKE